MALSNYVKEKISFEVIKTLVSRFNCFPEDSLSNRNAPFHKAFLNAFENKLTGKVKDIPFLITLSSWLHGLNTTLGQSFFENVAHHLCQGEKREYTSKKLGNVPISKSVKEFIDDKITKLSNCNEVPDKEDEKNNLNEKIHQGSEKILAMDFSADVYFEDEESVTAIELKSVKPNSGEMRGEKQKILEGKAALMTINSNKKVNFYIGFPFDPTSEGEDIGYDKDKFVKNIINIDKFFDLNEILLAEELWDMLSSEANTMRQILDIINTIATVDFQSNFQYLCDRRKRCENKYKDILTEWNMFSELELLANNNLIKSKFESDKSKYKAEKRIFNQLVFYNNGDYNNKRFETLVRLI